MCGFVILLKCSRIKTILDAMQTRAQNGTVFQIFATEVKLTVWKSHSSQGVVLAENVLPQMFDTYVVHAPAWSTVGRYHTGTVATTVVPVYYICAEIVLAHSYSMVYYICARLCLPIATVWCITKICAEIMLPRRGSLQ